MFEERGGHNVKEPDFFVLFFCFVLVGFFVGGGGGRMFLRGNEGRINRYQLSIKGGIQRIDSQGEGIIRILWSLMGDQGIFIVTQLKSCHPSPPSLPELQIPTCPEYLCV